jgi:hypothetical protein
MHEWELEHSTPAMPMVTARIMGVSCGRLFEEEWHHEDTMVLGSQKGNGKEDHLHLYVNMYDYPRCVVALSVGHHCTSCFTLISTLQAFLERLEPFGGLANAGFLRGAASTRLPPKGLGTRDSEGKCRLTRVYLKRLLPICFHLQRS